MKTWLAERSDLKEVKMKVLMEGSRGGGGGREGFKRSLVMMTRKSASSRDKIPSS